MTRAIVAVVLAVFLLCPVAYAQFAPDKKAAGKKEAADAGKKDAKKDEKKTATPVDRMIRDLKALVAREKAKPEYSKELVKELETLIRTHEKNRKPVKLEDLSDEDRKRLTAEVRKQIEAENRERGGGRDGGGGGGDWADRAVKGRVDSVMEKAELSDEEKTKAEGLLTDFAKDVTTAVRNGDNKLVKDLKNDLEKQLRKKIGHTKTKKVMNEVNKQFGGRGRWGGR
jgi:hypothetical protein